MAGERLWNGEVMEHVEALANDTMADVGWTAMGAESLVRGKTSADKVVAVEGEAFLETM